MYKYTHSFLVFVIFLAVYLFTINDYGISWDEPIHFHRGQAYLNFYLSGNKDFANIPEQERSYYQSESLSAEYFIKNDSGHPPLNGIIASFFNLVLFKYLNFFSDIHSYHVFEIICSTITILIVSVFATQIYGRLAGVISGIVIGTYPLLVAESHFNIKDPPLTTFYTLTLWCFWMSLKRGSWKWLLGSILAFYLGFSTKFNMVFLPFILLPYVLLRYFNVYIKGLTYTLNLLSSIEKKYIILIFLAPFIIGTLFVLSWPFLWQDTLQNFMSIVGYYKEIGTGPDNREFNFFKGFNSFPVIWILTTTPPIVLVLFCIGLLKIIKDKGLKDKSGYLCLIWFIIPVLRVTIPNASIYGGIRQIMEFIPAMALISGIGGAYLVGIILSTLNIKLYRNIIALLIIVLLFLPHILILIKLHPNENVYFNSLIGGIQGAEKYKIPFRGNSFGNAYWQGIQWLNNNAEPNSKLALVQGTGLNIPKIMLRKDIKYSNWFWSGINREGEYLMELTHHDNVRSYPYAWEYIETFLEPVYEVKVDGFSIAKIWKNDIEHTKKEYRKNQIKLNNINTQNDIGSIHVLLGGEHIITQLVLKYDKEICFGMKGNVSVFSNSEWVEEPEPISNSEQIPSRNLDSTKNIYRFFFPARKGSEIKIENIGDSCLNTYSDLEVYILE